MRISARISAMPALNLVGCDVIALLDDQPESVREGVRLGEREVGGGQRPGDGVRVDHQVGFSHGSRRGRVVRRWRSVSAEPSRQLYVELVEVDVAHALEELGGPGVGQGLGQTGRRPASLLGLQGAELLPQAGVALHQRRSVSPAVRSRNAESKPLPVRRVTPPDRGSLRRGPRWAPKSGH